MEQESTGNMSNKIKSNKDTSSTQVTGYNKDTTIIDTKPIAHLQTPFSKELLTGVQYKAQMEVKSYKSQKEINAALDELDIDLQFMIDRLQPITLEQMSECLYLLFLVNKHVLPDTEQEKKDFYAVYSNELKIFPADAIQYAVSKMVKESEYPSIKNIRTHANKIYIPRVEVFELLQHAHKKIAEQLEEK